jgi:class 3 adenylate cyclase
MELQMITLNMKMTAQCRQLLRMRIVHLTGLVVAGSLSSMERVKHETTGDRVGAAARLESFD